MRQKQRNQQKYPTTPQSYSSNTICHLASMTLGNRQQNLHHICPESLKCLWPKIGFHLHSHPSPPSPTSSLRDSGGRLCLLNLDHTSITSCRVWKMPCFVFQPSLKAQREGDAGGYTARQNSLSRTFFYKYLHSIIYRPHTSITSFH